MSVKKGGSEYFMYPKVSVIMPTCKRAHFLVRAIESVLNQTYPNIEVVVVDDNSDDNESRLGTESVMQKYSLDERVKYIQNKDKCGGGISRNFGIEAAKGEYITFLDDDDMYTPPKIESQLKFMMMHSLDMSFTDLHIYAPNGKLTEHRTRRFVRDWSTETLLKQHLIYALTSTPTFMAKKDLLLKIGGFRNVPVGQDYVLMWDILEYAEKHSEVRVGYLPCSYIVVYLHNEGRISVGQRKIDGEMLLYKMRCSRKDMLTKNESKFVDFRLYSVLAVTCKRGGMNKEFLKYALKAFNISPVFTFREAFSFIKKRFESKDIRAPQ